MNGFTRLVITSATKNSKNLTSEIGEYKQWKVATIVGKRIIDWKIGKGFKKTAKNVQRSIVANKSGRYGR